jgi:hypothetical protein
MTRRPQQPVKHWTPADLEYYYEQRRLKRTAIDIAKDFGVTEWSLRHAIYRSEFGREAIKPQAEDLFTPEDCSIVTGIKPERIRSLIKDKTIRGNGLVERKDLANFLCRYPASCVKGDIIQIIYILGGDKCSPNLK